MHQYQDQYSISTSTSEGNTLQDVSLGVFDAIIGPVWVLTPRLKHVSYLPTLGSDDLYVYVEAWGEESLAETIAKPFKVTPTHK